MNSGGIDDGGRTKRLATVVAIGLTVAVGLVVVGGGIALFLTTLFG